MFVELELLVRVKILLHNELMQLIDELPTDRRRAVAALITIAAEHPSFITPLAHDRQDGLLDIIRQFVEAFSEDTRTGT